MDGNPNAPADEAERMGHLKDIMPAAGYKKYIDQVIDYSRQNGIKILFDMHGAPGSQSPESNSGCSHKFGSHFWSQHYYWDTDWNKKWTQTAISAIAQICKDAGETCYGVELLNEPDYRISRSHLKEFYQSAIKDVRENVGLPMEVPMVVMEWAIMWFNWEG